METGRSRGYKTTTLPSQSTRNSERPVDPGQTLLSPLPEYLPPSGMTLMSNVPTNTRGEFTNVRKDFYSDQQGLWCNGNFNTPGATIDRGVGTYSNLQGAWARMGPSTYDASHGRGDWVPKYGCAHYEPPTLRSLYDHRNIDPRDNWIPILDTNYSTTHSLPPRK